jgi:hypothetical protein
MVAGHQRAPPCAVATPLSFSASKVSAPSRRIRDRQQVESFQPRDCRPVCSSRTECAAAGDADASPRAVPLPPRWFLAVHADNRLLRRRGHDGRYWARTSDPQLVELGAHRSTMRQLDGLGQDLGHAYRGHAEPVRKKPCELAANGQKPEPPSSATRSLPSTLSSSATMASRCSSAPASIRARS